MTTTIGVALLRALKGAGATEIFGIPGDFALPLFNAIEASAILPLFTLSHEPAVGFAADAASRYHGGLGVAAVTFGAGALNMVNAVTGAYAEKSPLVVLSGGPSAADHGGDLMLHHQARSLYSQFEVYREITVAQVVLNDAKTAPDQIGCVLRRCLEASRPVYIEVPRDMLDVPCEAVTLPPASTGRLEVVEEAAAEVIALLRGAERPMILAGVEVKRFGLETKLATLCRRLGVPVATTFMARGLLVEQDVPLLGTYLGRAGEPSLSAQVENTDGLLMMGVLMSDTNFGVSGKHVDMRHAALAADRGVRIGYHSFVDVPLEFLLDALLDAAGDTITADGPLPSAGQIDEAHEARVEGPEARDEAPDKELDLMPADIAQAISDLFSEHGPMPIASDMGDCLFTALEAAQSPLVAPGYYATMGFGVPAGLGVQAATGDRPLIIVGDGAFQMTGFELGNCQRYGWDPIVIVMNNSGWGMLRTFAPEAGYNDLAPWRYATLAEGLGGDGYTVNTRGAFRAALANAHHTRGRFQLIDAKIPKNATSATLRRFVDAISTAR